MRDLIVVGAGGFGQAVAEAATLGGQFRVTGFVDDRWPGLANVFDLPVLASLETLPAARQQASHAIVAVGHNGFRRRAFEQLRQVGFQLATLIHPQAIVSPSAHLADGVIVMASAVVSTRAQIGEGVIINAGAIVDHHAQAGAFAHLGIGARLGGEAVVGPGAWIQEGRAVPPSHTIAADTIVPRHVID